MSFIEEEQKRVKAFLRLKEEKKAQDELDRLRSAKESQDLENRIEAIHQQSRDHYKSSSVGDLYWDLLIILRKMEYNADLYQVDHNKAVILDGNTQGPRFHTWPEFLNREFSFSNVLAWTKDHEGLDTVRTNLIASEFTPDGLFVIYGSDKTILPLQQWKGKPEIIEEKLSIAYYSPIIEKREGSIRANYGWDDA